MPTPACRISKIAWLEHVRWPAGTQDAAAAAKADAQAPAWAAVSAIERAAWMQATILQAVNTMLGRTMGLEEPLMTAGLDSLGTVTTFAEFIVFAFPYLPRLAFRPYSPLEGHLCRLYPNE